MTNGQFHETLKTETRRSDEDVSRKKRVQNTNTKKLQSLKTELKHLLSQPLVAHGVMKKYITSGARSVVSELLNSDGECVLLFFSFRGGNIN